MFIIKVNLTPMRVLATAILAVMFMGVYETTNVLTNYRNNIVRVRVRRIENIFQAGSL